MITVCFNEPKDNSGYFSYWYDNKNNKSLIQYIFDEGKSLGEIKYILCNGLELEYVKGKFANLPYPYNERNVMWFGDMAAFIVANFGEME